MRSSDEFPLTEGVLYNLLHTTIARIQGEFERFDNGLLKAIHVIEELDKALSSFYTSLAPASISGIFKPGSQNKEDQTNRFDGI